MSSLSSSIADLRKSYERAELSESASDPNPLQQFDQWLQEAVSAQVPEPNAMTVATVSEDLRPSTRIVLIKGYDERGIVWYTNYDSRKGRQLAGNPFAALQFHWVGSSAWCASKAVWKKSAPRKAMPTLPAARLTPGLVPGPVRKARSSAAAARL